MTSKNTSPAVKTALGAILIALSVIILIPTVFDSFVFALPCFAQFLTMLAVVELGRSWAFGVYTGTALISLLVLPNKEAAVFYAFFFGYYPIIKSLIEGSRLRIPRILEYVIKLAVFNAAMIGAYFVLIKAFGMPLDKLFDIKDPDSFFGRFFIPIMLAAGNVTFILMDYVLNRILTFYLRFWQKRFHRMIKRH